MLEHGVRAPVCLRKSTGANGRNQFSANMYRKLVSFLRRSPNIPGNLREFSGECNLGILYSSSLLRDYGSDPQVARMLFFKAGSLRLFNCAVPAMLSGAIVLSPQLWPTAITAANTSSQFRVYLFVYYPGP